MTFEREREVYLRERPGWVRSGLTGRWIVICGEDVLGDYESLEAAIEAGYERYGLDSLFLARQITETDPQITASRRAVHAPRHT